MLHVDHEPVDAAPRHDLHELHTRYRRQVAQDRLALGEPLFERIDHRHRYSEPPRAAHYRRARIGVEAVSGGPATARVALAGLAADALVACGHEALGLVSASPFALE